MTKGLHLILFDRTCTNRVGLGLTRAWSNGARLYAALGRSQGAYGAGTWGEGLDFLSRFQADQPIDEIQFWGHGKWGHVFVGGEPLDRSVLSAGHVHHRALAAVRARLSRDALFWFRTCETFGASAGHDFAQSWADFFASRAAGHTHIIGYWQSGLHLLHPGNAPHWLRTEGLVQGSAEKPERAAGSARQKPNTISCLTGHVPHGW